MKNVIHFEVSFDLVIKPENYRGYEFLREVQEKLVQSAYERKHYIRRHQNSIATVIEGKAGCWDNNEYTTSVQNLEFKKSELKVDDFKTVMEWLKTDEAGQEWHRCSECGNVMKEANKYGFCPYCGRAIRKVEQDAD